MATQYKCVSLCASNSCASAIAISIAPCAFASHRRDLLWTFPFHFDAVHFDAYHLPLALLARIKQKRPRPNGGNHSYGRFEYARARWLRQTRCWASEKVNRMTKRKFPVHFGPSCPDYNSFWQISERERRSGCLYVRETVANSYT